MTTMTRFVPLRSTFNEMAALQDRLNSIFSEFARPAVAENQAEGSPAMGSFVPAVDIYEDAQALVLHLEVPGVKQSDLDLRLENQTLTIKGERKLENTSKQEKSVDTENVTAAYDAGVLTVTLAKKAEAQPRQVKIEVATPNREANASTIQGA
jgi:HSP20 family protein